MFSFEGLDIDQLHFHVNHRNDNMWADSPGRTTAFISLMVGEAQLGDLGNTYLYVGETYRWIKEVAHNLADVLKGEGYSVTMRDNPVRVSLYVGNKDRLVRNFWFVTADAIKREDIRGCVFDDIYVDLTSETMDRLDEHDLDLLQSRLREKYNETHNTRQ